MKISERPVELIREVNVAWLIAYSLTFYIFIILYILNKHKTAALIPDGYSVSDITYYIHLMACHP